MNTQNVQFYPGLEKEDRIVIYINPDAFVAEEPRATYAADLFTTDKALVIKVNAGNTFFLATGLSLLEGIKSGKEVWISHLHPTLNYVLDQAKLKFELAT
jgi:hypothetical protein